MLIQLTIMSFQITTSMLKVCFFIFSFLLLSSCEKEIPYDYTNFEKKLAVDAIVENGVAKLYISQNSSTLSLDTVWPINNAEVFINGIKIDEKGKNDYPYTRFLANVKPGDKLNLTVSFNGFPEITSEATIPQKPGFKILSSRIVQGKELLWYDKYTEITIEIDKNEVNSSDYYIIELLKTKYAYDEKYNATTMQWEKTLKKYIWPEYFYTNDQVADISGSGLAFELNKTEFSLGDDMVNPTAFIISDKTFDGKSKKIIFMTQVDPTNFYRFYEFRISAINKGYYEFIQSVAAYNFNSGMFNEPIRIKSNINGGFGYFGIKTTVIDSIKISDIK